MEQMNDDTQRSRTDYEEEPGVGDYWRVPRDLAGRTTSGRLDRFAEVLQRVKLDRLKSDIQRQVRRNPGRSLLIAGLVGGIIGLLLRRR